MKKAVANANKEAETCEFLKELDFYKYLPHGLAQPSLIGATMSSGFILFMGVIMFYQLTEFISY
jgi:hypothetical protein